MQHEYQRDDNNSVGAPAHKPENQPPHTSAICFRVSESRFFEWRNVWSHDAPARIIAANERAIQRRVMASKPTLAPENALGKQTMATWTRIRHLPI